MAEQKGFSKDELKANIDKIADNTKKSIYSNQQSVEKTRASGKDMVDEYLRG